MADGGIYNGVVSTQQQELRAACPLRLSGRERGAAAGGCRCGVGEYAAPGWMRDLDERRWEGAGAVLCRFLLHLLLPSYCSWPPTPSRAARAPAWLVFSLWPLGNDRRAEEERVHATQRTRSRSVWPRPPKPTKSANTSFLSSHFVPTLQCKTFFL
jgi:hypothetical protein